MNFGREWAIMYRSLRILGATFAEFCDEADFRASQADLASHERSFSAKIQNDPRSRLWARGPAPLGGDLFGEIVVISWVKPS